MAVQFIEPQATLIFEQECRRLMSQHKAFHDAWADRGCDHRMCERLVELLEEHPQRPVEEFEPLVHRLLIDLSFCGENGDLVFEPGFRHKIEDQVRMLVQAMLRVRDQLKVHGSCDLPMYG